MEKKKLPSFTPESEIEEDESSSALRSGEGEEGNGTIDFFTWLENNSSNREGAAESEGERNPPQANGESPSTRISER